MMELQVLQSMCDELVKNAGIGSTLMSGARRVLGAGKRVFDSSATRALRTENAAQEAAAADAAVAKAVAAAKSKPKVSRKGLFTSVGNRWIQGRRAFMGKAGRKEYAAKLRALNKDITKGTVTQHIGKRVVGTGAVIGGAGTVAALHYRRSDPDSQQWDEG